MRDGTVDKADGRVTFRYERKLAHPCETVWHAITDSEEMEAWTGMVTKMDLRPDGEYVSHHSNGDRVVDRIVTVEPPRKLAHTWWMHVNPSALVTWELTPDGDGCTLVLTHSLDIDDARNAAAQMGSPDEWATMLSRNGAGWHHLLDMLDARLDGQSLDWSPEQQQELQERYRAP